MQVWKVGSDVIAHHALLRVNVMVNVSSDISDISLDIIYGIFC